MDTTKDIEAGKIFLSRMMPFLVSGMTFEKAGLAVLNRDKELAIVALSDTEEGESLRKEMMTNIYNEVKTNS